MDPRYALSAYLFGQLRLNAADNDTMRAAALRHFQQAWESIKQRQAENGGQGLNGMADALRWLEAKTLKGMMNSQPGVRRLVLRDELDGPANQFGTKLMKRILSTFGENHLPGTGVAIQVSYRDRYINTPCKVALLAHWMAALKRYLEKNNRWNVQSLEIETTKKDQSGQGNLNQPWPSCHERNDVLRQTLSDFGVEPNKVLTNWRVPHDRDLKVTFEDKSELQIDLGQGLSFWKAVPGGEHSIDDFSFYAPVPDQSNLLFQGKFAVSHDGELTNCYVEWRQAPSL